MTWLLKNVVVVHDNDDDDYDCNGDNDVNNALAFWLATDTTQLFYGHRLSNSDINNIFANCRLPSNMK